MIRRRPVDVFADRELVELLEGDPSLLSVAAAVAAHAEPERTPWVRRGVVTGAVVLAAACAVVLVAPWRGGGNPLLGRALGAVGSGRVMHVVVRSNDPLDSVVDARTGASSPRLVEREIWFDSGRDQMRVVTRRGGSTTSDQTVAGVGRAGAGPSLDPAIVVFVTDFRRAVKDGDARATGAIEIGRRAAETFELAPPGGPREQVALDRRSGRPLAFWSVGPDGRVAGARWLLTRASSTDAASAFAPAHRSSRAAQVGSQVVSTRPLTLRRAGSLWPRTPALWAQRTIAGLALGAVERQWIRRGNGSTGTGVSLLYGVVLRGRIDRSRAYLVLSEAVRPEQAYGFRAGGLTFNSYPMPQAGSYELAKLPQAGSRSTWLAQLHRGRIFVTLEASSRSLVRAAVAQLQTIDVEPTQRKG
ncbi:MAG TPA: hypothetical protein VHC45_09795 [Gaiellaceae bacterium]|nr:hypothetical protein [Gaiellaceae bacterium]